MTTPTITATDRAAIAICELIMRTPKQVMSRALLSSLMQDRGYSESAFDKAVHLTMAEGNLEKIGRRQVMYAWRDEPIAVDTNQRVVKQIPAEAVHMPGIRFANGIEWGIRHCLQVCV